MDEQRRQLVLQELSETLYLQEIDARLDRESTAIMEVCGALMELLGLGYAEHLVKDDLLQSLSNMRASVDAARR